MSDAQKFTVTKPAGKPLVHAEDLIDAIGSYGQLSTFLTEVKEVPNEITVDPTSSLIWRVKHNGTTVAATDSADSAARILLLLADDIIGWVVTAELEVI